MSVDIAVKEKTMNNLEIPNKILIDPTVLRKVMYWVNKAPGEVSGLGCVEMRDGNPMVTEVYLLDQENTAGSTELDADAVAKLMNEHRDKDFRWWWHSHANMGVFWSGTDSDTIKEFGGNGWLTATVFNKKKETKSAIYTTAKTWNPMTSTTKDIRIFLDDVALEVRSIEDPVIEAQWEEEYTKTCKTKTFKTYGSFNHDNWEKRREFPYYDEWIKDHQAGNWDYWLEREMKLCKDLKPERYHILSLYEEYMAQKKDWKEFYAEKKFNPAITSLDIKYLDDCDGLIQSLKKEGKTYLEVCDEIEESWGNSWLRLVDDAFGIGDGDFHGIA